MSRIETYHQVLKTLPEWEPFLLQESGLPGPRGNLELMQAAADLGTRTWFEQCLALTPDAAPENTSQVFLAICGVVGLGRLLAEGDQTWLPRLRVLASDPRWRVREAVCMALQRFGKADMPALLHEMTQWATGNLLEQRAVAAGLCEPDLLVEPKNALAVLDILDTITETIQNRTDRKSEEFRVLRKGLAYCWSVAVVALPEDGKRRMERWFNNPDANIRWIMKQNLKKNRLSRLDPVWVERNLRQLEALE